MYRVIPMLLLFNATGCTGSFATWLPNDASPGRVPLELAEAECLKSSPGFPGLRSDSELLATVDGVTIARPSTESAVDAIDRRIFDQCMSERGWRRKD